MSRVNEALNEFNSDSITVKLLDGIFNTVPHSPQFQMWTSVDDAVRALKPSATESELELARNIAAGNDQVNDILWMSRLLDSGDKGYAIVTGLATAWKLFKGQGVESFETDNQQRNDAVLKALGLSYMVYKAYPGSVAERADAFRTSPTGQAMAIYYGTIEVALPFADNAAMSSSGALEQLLSKDGDEQMRRMSQLAQGHDVDGAAQMMSQLTEQLQRVADHAANYVKPVAEQIGPYMPGAMNAADKAAGALANAADVLPVYRLLGARLAAESAARRALTPSAE
ncbi:MAG TPA: hypothetical protein ENK18_23705 [Deltaproteobacteria bacterium]|nr:hypothetical protein [Deltaproteobacteria bacterium]